MRKVVVCYRKSALNGKGKELYDIFQKGHEFVVGLKGVRNYINEIKTETKQEVEKGFYEPVIAATIEFYLPKPIDDMGNWKTTKGLTYGLIKGKWVIL